MPHITPLYPITHKGTTMFHIEHSNKPTASLKRVWV